MFQNFFWLAGFIFEKLVLSELALAILSVWLQLLGGGNPRRLLTENSQESYLNLIDILEIEAEKFGCVCDLFRVDQNGHVNLSTIQFVHE